MSKLKVAILSALIVAGLTLGSIGAYADEVSGTIDFKDKTCKEVMRMSGRDRDIALAFVHGYRLGKMGTTRYDVDTLAQITDKFIDYCLDHPAENALQSFEKVAE